MKRPNYNITSTGVLCKDNGLPYASYIIYNTIYSEEIRYKVITYNGIFNNSLEIFDFNKEEYLKYLNSNNLGIKHNGVF